MHVAGGKVRWSRLYGQFGSRVKLITVVVHAACLIIGDQPYSGSGFLFWMVVRGGLNAVPLRTFSRTSAACAHKASRQDIDDKAQRKQRRKRQAQANVETGDEKSGKTVFGKVDIIAERMEQVTEALNPMSEPY